MKRKGTIVILVAIVVAGLLCGCSTKKNTGLTRFYHSFTARYNTTFNGQQAFLEGLMAQEKGHKDNYTTLLPMYMASDKSTAGMGKSNYERAIEKSEKAIKKHSIKVKPTRKSRKRMSDKEKAYRNRREFNPFLKRPWLLLAESQFRKGEFIEAASTYSYIIRLYADQPDVVSVAKAWLARCYVALEWPYDAEDVLRKAARDSMTAKGRREYEQTQAAYYILTGQYKEALPGLKTAVRHEPRSVQRARLNYLLGQVGQLAGDEKTAYQAWQRVIRSSPPYELAFNARLRQAEVMGGNAGSRAKVLRKLRRMARSDKNSDYLDQVYHAIGNVYLAAGDTMHAVYAMKTGVEKATQSGTAKAALMLHLGQLYWEQENYIDAAEMYGQCASSFDKKHSEYAETQRRADILKVLAPPLSDVKLQDSLLVLSTLSEAERNAAIDRVIKELKRKEKEEAKKLGDQEGAAGGGSVNRPNQPNQPTPPPAANPINKPGEKGAWYFYNPQTVLQGKRAFMQQWGNRKLEDNWRRINKSANTGSESDEGFDYDADDAESADENDDEADALADSLANDPHHREYYLRQIPFDDDAKAVAHATIAQGLFKAGLIEITPLENYPLAERTLTRLITDYPDFESMPDVYYNMFLLFGRQGMTGRAAACRDTIVNRWPDHDYARLLLNPRYEQNARNGKHIEDSLYATAYDHYRQAQYAAVTPLFDIHTEDFPDGPHRGRFLFVRAMSALYDGDRDTFFETMKTLTEKYSNDSLSVWAKGIVQGVQEGRMLNADGMDMSSLWSRHDYLADGDSTAMAADTLTADRLTDFAFVLAWPAHTLDENQLLFEMARYNFSTFVARNFEIELDDKGTIHRLMVTGFTNYDEVHTYVQSLYLDPHMRERLDGIRTFIISQANLKLIGRRYSYDDYDTFFDLNFAPDDVPDDLRIDEPEVEIIDPENIDPDAPTDSDDEDTTPTDDFEWPW